MSGTQEQQHWPNRGLHILVPTTILCILSTAVLTWRVVYGVMSKRKLMLCDYLLIVAASMNITTTGVRFKTVRHGSGRHIIDPSITKPYDLMEYSYYLWIGQVINLMAVAVLKFSICAYLLALKFSRVYMGVVWASILMVTVFNFLIPLMNTTCKRPFQANWNKAVPGKCFMRVSGLGIVYSQGLSNIVTDVVYVVAPLIYLSTIQIPRRTQWGLRIVFCLGLVVTACSIVKTIDMGSLTKTHDPTWEGTNLSIWSATELSVGILVASLPPLRKQFDAIFRRILPSSFMGSRSRTQGGGAIQMYNVSKPYTIGSKPSGTRRHEDDGDSEHHILSEGERKITKTVVHEIRSGERGIAVPMPTRSYSMQGKDFA